MSRFNDWALETVQVIPAPVASNTPAPSTKWPMCPDCKESATGMYGKHHGCSRCGWVEGNGLDHHKKVTH